MTRPTGRVFVIDDDPADVSVLQGLLSTAAFEVYTFTSAALFLQHRLPPPPVCVVLDQGLRGVSGLELQARLADDGVLSVVFLTRFQHIPTVVQAMKRGAIDVLAKPVDPPALVRAVTRGLERSARAEAERGARERFEMHLLRLTPREHQVVAGVLRGLLNKQIAWELGIAEKTVKVHRARAMEKLEVGSVAELATIVEQTNTALIPPDAYAR